MLHSNTLKKKKSRKIPLLVLIEIFYIHYSVICEHNFKTFSEVMAYQKFELVKQPMIRRNSFGNSIMGTMTYSAFAPIEVNI